MNAAVRSMLEKMHGVFLQHTEDSVQAWDRFMEFLAADHKPEIIRDLEHKFDWLLKDSKLAQSLLDTYNPALLHSDYHDHLGEMYIEKIVTKKDAERKGLFLTPMEVSRLTASMTIPETEDKITVLDPCVGSGRMLMAGYERARNGCFFGVDSDLRVLRVAYTNFAIHNIHGYLLHANSLVHETNIATEEGRKNWEYSNRWHSHMDKLIKITASSSTTRSDGKSPDLIELTDQSDLFKKQ